MTKTKTLAGKLLLLIEGLKLQPVPILFAALCFCASLTPSLMPRDPVVQGILGGTVGFIGYVIALFTLWLWRFMELPLFGKNIRDIFHWPLFLAATAVAIFALAMAADWQNATRAAVGIDPVDSAAPLVIAPVAAAMFLALGMVSRIFAFSLARVVGRLKQFLPTRMSLVIGFAAVAWLYWAAVDGLLISRLLAMADSSFEAADTLIEPDLPQPENPWQSGSSASLLDWEEIGRWGRRYVSWGPTADEISQFAGRTALDPIRVYVGRRSADTPRQRAELALKELIRAGGFDRSVLVVVVPVGTGWLDPGGHDTLEFMLGGDVATVAVQYSYLTSALALFTHPEYGIDQARHLFDVVYDHWAALPKENRPKLYVHGLSQGSLNSQITLPLLDVLGDPISGALWTGSPFLSPFWQDVRSGRHPESPAWLPLYGNGSLARVMIQDGRMGHQDARWGPIRIVFLQYASDAIVVFSFDTAFQRPDWMRGERAPDVSDKLSWYPLVTMFQTALDMTISLNIPGHGHYYKPADYIDAWAAVLDPPGWSAEKSKALKAIFAARPPNIAP